jgi:hypothetical protein
MKAQRATTAECYAAGANFDCLRENIFEYMLMNINDEKQWMRFSLKENGNFLLK